MRLVQMDFMGGSILETFESPEVARFVEFRCESQCALEYLQNTELVPESGSIALLALGGCFVASRRRRS
jgi:hypothetical protein